jgi:hypothetical protein
MELQQLGWPVLGVQLPEGWSLREDEYFVYLCRNGQVCAIFSSAVATPAVLAAAIAKEECDNDRREGVSSAHPRPC